MSEGAAFRRITAARLARKFPSLLRAIERGEIHLSALVLLRDHLTDANVDELIAAASGKSKRAVEELVARRAPRPDVPSTLRKLPRIASTPLTPSEASPPPSRPEGGQVAPASVTTDVPTPRPAQRARLEPLAEDRYKLQLTAAISP